MNRALVWRTIQNSTWLLGGLVMLGIAFFLWIGIQIHDRIVVEKPLDQGDTPIEPEKVRFSPTLGMMTDIVPVLDLSQSTSESIHTAEFRGADYIKSQNNRWFLHVMTVTKVEVVKSYLASRADRKQFTYFRYLEPKQPVRYVLAYGTFSAVNQALEAGKTVKFDLPDSVKVYPKRFSELKKFVSDEVTADEKISNLGGANQLYQVKLRSVPVPVEQPVQLSSQTIPSSLPSASASQPSMVNPLSTAPVNTGQTGAGSTSTGATNTASASTGSASTGAAIKNSTSPNQPASANTGNNNVANPAKPIAPAKPAASSPSTNGSNTSTNTPAPNQSGATVEAPRPIADPFN